MAKDVYAMTDAAEELGVPRRTVYFWLSKGLVPTVRLSENRVVMTGQQMRLVRAVLKSEGRKGILSGLCIAAN